MRSHFYGIILLLVAFPLVAGKYKLIESRHIPDNTKDCRKIGNCLTDVHLNKDTLKVTVYINNEFRDLNSYRDSFTIDRDTLSLNLNDTNAIRYSYVYDKEKNKIDTLVTGTAIFRYSMDDSYDTRRMELPLPGLLLYRKEFSLTMPLYAIALPYPFNSNSPGTIP